MTFTKDQIAFVYGSKWKQRYFRKVGDDYCAAAGAVGRHPPAVARLRCDRCDQRPLRRLPLRELRHQRKTVTEWNVGCERCHGPGSEHVARPARATSSTRRRLDPDGGRGRLRPVPLGRASDHAPSKATTFHWPVGFKVGLQPARLLAARRHTPGDDGHAALSRTARPARTGCRETTTCRA